VSADGRISLGNSLRSSEEDTAASKGVASFAIDSEGHMRRPSAENEETLDEAVTDDMVLLQTDVESFKEDPAHGVFPEEDEFMDSTPILLLQDNMELFHGEVVEG